MINLKLTPKQLDEGYEKFLSMYEGAPNYIIESNLVILKYGQYLLKQLNKHHPIGITKMVDVKAKCKILEYIS